MKKKQPYYPEDAKEVGGKFAPSRPIYKNRMGYWYSDECEQIDNGPYDSFEEAEQAQEEHFERLR